MPSHSISDPFVVTSLPRLPAKPHVSKICTVSNIDSPSTTTFDIGVSGSFIGTFITRPTPKMIWSYALSPQATVDSLDSLTIEENDEREEEKLFVVCSTERKKSTLRFITYGSSKSDENGEDQDKQSVSVTNEEERNTAEPEALKEVKAKNVNVNSKIIGLKISIKGDKVFSLSEDGVISIWRFNTDENNEESSHLKTFEPTTLKKKSSVIFHSFIKPEELQINKSDNVEVLLLTVEVVNKLFNVKIFAIDGESILEVSNSTIESLDSKVPTSDYQVTYDPSGKLLLLEQNNELELHIFSLPYTKKQKTISLSQVFTNEPTESSTSFLPASTNRVLISKGSTIALIDLQYEALLGSLDLYSKSKTQMDGSTSNTSFKPPRTASLLKCPTVNGTSLRTKNTFALVLLKNPKENHALLEYVSIDVGLGKLNDVLGKGLANSISKSSKEFVGLPSLVTEPEFGSTNKEISDLVSKSNELSTEAFKFYESLVDLKSQNKIDELEASLVAYLKNTSGSDTKEEDDEKSKTQQQFKVFELEKDRVVAPYFINKVVELLFDFNKESNCLSLSKDFLPENSLTYLLTHPLFPSQYAAGILHVLHDSPRLMRQAIVTCPNILCKDMIEQLSLVDNDEIFKDLIARLIEEFSTETITEETVKLIKMSSQSTSSIKEIDLDKIISKIIKLNYGYEILNSFIDSNGLVLSLHYSKNESQLSKLMIKSLLKVDSLMMDTQILTLVNQALLLSEREQLQDKKLKKKKNQGKGGKKREVEVNNENIVVESSKLDSILATYGKNSKSIKFDELVSKKVPAYSIEKLTI